MTAPPFGVRYFQSSGNVTIEFALVLPLLALLLTALIDLGYAAYESMEVQQAAEAGAQYASLNTWDVTAIDNAVTGATGVSGITANPAPSQFCACADGAALTAVSCSTTCSGGHAASKYALVSAQLQHWSILRYPGLPNPMTLTAQSWRRLQ